MFPKHRMDDINQVLDHIYNANGGQVALAVQSERDSVFGSVFGGIRSFQKQVLRSYVKNAKDVVLKECYEAALKRSELASPTLEDWMDRTTKTMTFLEDKLLTSKGSWLFGSEYTAADAIAAVWVQWMVWSNPSSIEIPQVVVEFLDRVKARDGWKVTNPEYGLAPMLSVLRIVVGLVWGLLLSLLVVIVCVVLL